jgi:Flp pilus assembly pilin Flp
MFARLVRNEQGATIVEFSLVFVLLMLLTWGIVEFGYLWWQWNSAEKATQMGVRKAVVTSPVATEIMTASCGPAGTPPGTSCGGLAGFGTAVCTGSAGGGGTCTGGYTFNTTTNAAGQTPFDAILIMMQGVFPLIQRENVSVTYTYIQLGFVGRPEPVPAVTVQLTGMSFSFFALQGLLGRGPIGLPSFEATLTGEALDSFAPS